MADVVERNVAEVTVRIDRLLCVGFEDCVVRAPEVFRLDGEGIACFTDASGPIDQDRLIDACRACPVDALVALDKAGRQLAP